MLCILWVFSKSVWLNGRASDYGSEGCRFESCHGCFFPFSETKAEGAGARTPETRYGSRGADFDRREAKRKARQANKKKKKKNWTDRCRRHASSPATRVWLARTWHSRPVFQFLFPFFPFRLARTHFKPPLLIEPLYVCSTLCVRFFFFLAKRKHLFG